MKLSQKLLIKQFYFIVSVFCSSAYPAKQYITYGSIGLTEISHYYQDKPEISGKCLNTTIRIIDFDKVTLEYILISKDSFYIELSNQKRSKKLKLDQKDLSDLISLNCIKDKTKELLIIKHRCLGNNITCEEDNHLVIDNRTLKILNSSKKLDECDEICLETIIEPSNQMQTKNE